MSVPLSFSAVLLAGGRSSRMGADKALLPTQGRPLWQRQVEVLRAAGAREIFFSVRPEQAWIPAGVQVVQDAVAGAGPLAGIAAALAACGDGHLAVLAVDLPRMEPAWFARLLERCGPGAGAVGRRGNFYEPLAAIYPRELLAAATEALARGELSLQAFIAGAGTRMRSVEIGSNESEWFLNWNEPSAAPRSPGA
ncbi:MAG: molybdenum cofactor guanylyltransferase [Opitutaceae bacterium]|nr:molybdenum cofactor guanylyltransferase [Opitutaceae bacterium]